MSITSKLINHAASHGPSELNRFAYLDGWRGLAIAFVLIAHFFQVKAIDLGTLGVNIFFVLSGLLMSKILFVKRVPLKTFYLRRFSRIFPAFFVFLTVIYASSYFLNLSSEHQNYFATLFFLRTYIPSDPNIWVTGLPVGHIWSLNVEEHSYLLLSLLTLVVFLRKREYLALIGLGLAAIVLRYVYMNMPEFEGQNFEIRTEVAASHLMLSCGYFLIKHKFEKYVQSWMPVAAFIVAILCFSDYMPWFSSWLLSPFLLAFAVNHLDRIPAFLMSLLSARPLQLLGIWSYSIYLWQQPYFHYGVEHGELFPYAGIAFLFAAILTGTASFYFIENPVRRYLNNKYK